MDTVARKVMELYTNQKGKDKTEQAYDALTCVWCRKQEKLFRLQSLAAVFQHFESQSHVRSQDGGVTHTHPAPQEQQPQVEQEQEPTDEEPVNDPASSGLEWSSDKHVPTSDELIELSKEQQEAILGGSGDLSFNMSPWIRALVSIVYDFNEGLPQYCAEQVLVLSNCVPAEFQQTLQQGASWREFICSLQKTTRHQETGPLEVSWKACGGGGAVKPVQAVGDWLLVAAVGAGRMGCCGGPRQQVLGSVGRFPHDRQLPGYQARAISTQGCAVSGQQVSDLAQVG